MFRNIAIAGQLAAFFTVSFIVGAIVVFAYLAVSSGGIESALNTILILTVCTLGIGLILLCGIAWGIGIIIVGPIWSAVLFYKYRTSGERETSGEIQQSLNPQQVALIEYMRKGSSYGWSETQIASRLKVQGWSDRDIEEAQQIIANR